MVRNCNPLYSEGRGASVAERLTPRTLGLEVRGSSLARRVVSLDEEPHSIMSLFTHAGVLTNVYRRHTARGKTYDGLASRPGGSSNTPTLASCYGNRDKLWPCGPQFGSCAPLPYLPYIRKENKILPSSVVPL